MTEIFTLLNAYPLWVKVTIVVLLAVCGLLLVTFKPPATPESASHGKIVAGRDVIIQTSPVPIDSARGKETPRFRRELCEKFTTFLRGLPEKHEAEARILAWVDGLDDELLLLGVAMSNFQGNGVTRSWVSGNSHPLGVGRSVPELIEALMSAGILAPTTEEIVPGTYAELDAKRNPSFDFGRNLFEARGLLRKADDAGLFRPKTESK